MPFDRRFALPTNAELDEMMGYLTPECGDCPVDDCTEETLEKCPHYIQMIKEADKLAEMEAYMDDDYEGWVKKK